MEGIGAGDRKSASGPVQHSEVQQPLHQAPIPMRQVSCSEELELAGLGLPDNGHTPHPQPMRVWWQQLQGGMDREVGGGRQGKLKKILRGMPHPAVPPCWESRGL